jgi:lipopolysaccharide transport system permease protein
MLPELKELYKFRELLNMIVWRDIRVKYKQSAMGFLWAIFMPAIVVFAGILVRYAMAAVSGNPVTSSQVLTVSIKAVPWAFCVAAVRFATNSLVANPNLVTKIYFPKEIFPIAAVLSNGFDFVIAAGLLLVVLAFVGIGVSIYLLWVPVLILIMLCFIMGIGMIFAALNLFFRDIKYLVEVILTFAIFITPVLYDVGSFHRMANVLYLNPLTAILEGLTASIVRHQSPPIYWIGYSALVSGCLLVGGYSMFKKLEFKFAENI